LEPRESTIESPQPEEETASDERTRDEEEVEETGEPTMVLMRFKLPLTRLPPLLTVRLPLLLREFMELRRPRRKPRNRRLDERSERRRTSF